MKGTEAVLQTTGPHMWTPFYTWEGQFNSKTSNQSEARVSGLNSEFPEGPKMLFTPCHLPRLQALLELVRPGRG